MQINDLYIQYSDMNLFWFKYYSDINIVEFDYRKEKPSNDKIYLQPDPTFLNIPECKHVLIYNLNDIDMDIIRNKDIYVFSTEQHNILLENDINSSIVEHIIKQKASMVEYSKSEHIPKNIIAIDIPIRIMNKIICDRILIAFDIFSPNKDETMTFVGNKNCKGRTSKYELLERIVVHDTTSVGPSIITKMDTDVVQSITRYVYIDTEEYYHIGKLFMKCAAKLER